MSDEYTSGWTFGLTGQVTARFKNIIVKFKETAHPDQIERDTNYLIGYADAVWDFSIWKDGKTAIGALGLSFEEVVTARLKAMSSVDLFYREDEKKEFNHETKGNFYKTLRN